MAMTPPDIDKLVRKPREDSPFRFVLNVVTRRWPWILLATILGTVVGFLIPVLTARQGLALYTAESDLIIRQTRWEQGPFKDLGVAPLFQSSPKALVDRVSKLAIARDVVRAMVQQDVAEGRTWGRLVTERDFEAATNEIAAALSIVPVVESGMVRLSCTRTNRPDAQRIVEFATRAFINRNRDFVMQEEQDTHAFVKRQLDELRVALESKETEEWQYRKQMGFLDYRQVVQKMQSWREELVETETSREQMLAQMARIEAELQDKNQLLPESLGKVTDAVVNQLLADLDKLLEEQLVMSIQYTDAYPPLQELKDDIAEKKQAILMAVSRLDEGQAGGTVWDQRSSLRRQYMQIELDLVSLDIRTQTINRLLSRLVDELPELASQDFEHQRLDREVGQLRNQFDRMLDKELEIRTSIQRGSGEVERHSQVRVTAVEAHRSNIMASALMGALIGLLCGLGLTMMFEANDTSIHTIEDATEYLGLEVIGTIPQMRFGKRVSGRRRGNYVPLTDEEQIHACVVTQHDPKSPVSEAYRTLRTRFQFATIKTKPRSMVVTSAVPGEGKTTTAANMAVTFADSGMRVLMVDTDLRRPNVHHVLRMERGLGLADVLREGVDVQSVIRPTRIDNLWMISSGRVPPNPSELIGSERMRRLMRELGMEFDLVICDAPSILVVTDPVLIATDVDTVVLVVAVDNARRETILHAKKLLETANADIAGVVLNGLAASRRHYYYYYYYYDEGVRKGKWSHLNQ